MKQYILLDWDGNLAKTLDVWLDAVRTTLVKRGLHLTDQEIATCFGAVHERFAAWGVTDMPAAIEEMDNIARRNLPSVALYPDALSVLEQLHHRGKHMALISASLRRNIHILLARYDMEHLFEVIIAYEDTTNPKPHPEPLEKALAALGGSKDDAVMIGDSDKDIGAANAAGIESILFYPPEHRKFYDLQMLQNLKPTHTVHDFRDVLRLV